ncbi:MAG: serine/threonine-protein phosphatase 6 regulatory ankyrin repeat subunit B-like [Gammaproteobacteria bacterium]|jgi:hypothetical protein|nr:serine/threonine-protein phosphatase 6 regulatory ankyrin repeat subunit B-like [Gammaproteobacteria bacterium]
MNSWHAEFSTHAEILLTAQALGYLPAAIPLAKQGHCYGLQLTAGCAILSGSQTIFSFNSRLCLIRSLFKSRDCPEDLKSTLPALQKDQVLELHCFFNTIIISQRPLDYLHFITLQLIDYNRNDYSPLFEIEPLIVEQQGGLHNVLVIPGLFLHTEIDHYVRSLEKSLQEYARTPIDKKNKQERNIPFFITIGQYHPSANHAIVLGYYPSAGERHIGSWFIYDANKGPIYQIRFGKRRYLANFLKTSLYNESSKEDHVVINSIVYCLGNHKPQALHLAAILKTELIQLEISKVINEENYYRKTVTQNSLLHYAAKTGNTELAKALLDEVKGIVNDQNIDQYSPLMFAAERGKADIVSLLIENGADIHMTQKQGICALALAAQKKEYEIVRILLNQYTVEMPDQSHAIFKAAYQDSDNAYFLLSKILENDRKNDLFPAAINFFLERKNAKALDFHIKNVFKNKLSLLLQKTELTSIEKESIIKLYILLQTTNQDSLAGFAAARFTAFFNPIRTVENKIENAYCLLNAVLKKHRPEQALLESPVLAEGHLRQIARLCFPEAFPLRLEEEIIYDWGFF